MRTVSAILVVLLLLTSCAKPEFWVKGLTLPPGSTIEERSETDKPGTLENGKSLRVNFNCPGGEAKVTGHIWKCLSAQGFKQADGMGMGTAVPGLEKFLESMKTFEHPSNGQAVMLQNMGGMLTGLDSSKYGKGDGKLGEMVKSENLMDSYVLTVIVTSNRD